MKEQLEQEQLQVLIFYPLGKNSEKPYGGGGGWMGGIHPPPLMISKCFSIIVTKS